MLLLLAQTAAHAQPCELDKHIPSPAGMQLLDFGAAVAIDDDAVIVGAPGPGSDCSPGVAEVYRWDGLAWVLEQTILPSDGQTGILFGSAVSVDGDVALVGAYQGNGALANTGAAYLFRRDPVTGSWSEEQKLTASTWGVGDDFGWSVSIAGDVAVVGAPDEDSFGAVHVYRRVAATGVWVEEQVLFAADPEGNADFGYSVSTDGTVIAIGARQDDALGSDSGAVYFHRYDGSLGQWVQEQKWWAPDAAASDLLGSSVALAGDLAVIGSRFDDDLGINSGSAYVLRRQIPGSWTLEQKLTAPDGLLSDAFGTAVSIHGDAIVVGAPQGDGAVQDSGSAYAYRFDPAAISWLFEQELFAGDGEEDDFFGGSVCIHGDTIVAGVREDSAPAALSGSASSFRYDSAATAWSQGPKLAPGDRASGDILGYSVAIRGDVAVAGAVGAPLLSPEPGAAYVYRRDPATGGWHQEQKLVPPDAAPFDQIGHSVAVDGDVVVVGSKNDDDLGENSGSVYVYRRDPVVGTWDIEQKLVASDGAAWDFFGSSVVVSGDLIAIGAARENTPAPGAGSVYLFRYDSGAGAWFQEQKLWAAGGATSDYFGESLSLSGELLAIGAPGTDDLGSNSGAVYFFRRDPVLGTWIEEQRVVASDGMAQDAFGGSVSLEGEVAVAGAFSANPLGENSGAAYVFRREPGSGLWVEETRLTASDGDSSDTFGLSVSLDGGLVVVGASGDEVPAAFTGSIYVYQYDTILRLWFEVEKILASDGSGSDQFGSSVAIHGSSVVVGATGDDDACLPFICNPCSSGAVYWFDLPQCLPVPEFVRGDANGDGAVDLGDALFGLTFLFTNGSSLCLDAQDANDDALIDIADPITLLAHLFSMGPPPPPPFPACSVDATSDGVSCWDPTCP